MAAGEPHGGLYHLRLRRATGYAEREVDLSDKNDVSIRVWVKTADFEEDETASILISQNGGDSWVTLRTWVDGEDDNEYDYYEFDVSAYVPSSEFLIAFDANMNWKYDYFYIDDLEVYGG